MRQGPKTPYGRTMTFRPSDSTVLNTDTVLKKGTLTQDIQSIVTSDYILCSVRKRQFVLYVRSQSLCSRNTLCAAITSRTTRKKLDCLTRQVRSDKVAKLKHLLTNSTE
ncbi:hypothetical protein NFI96_032604 [Prochilodus magdalenae]|nr:hypothetical protein NFI96_032604 [Prochilodus magdalenae]